ncbi:helix-turn-helix domain-containing protein [Lysobacter humi (ex Lee et al. 2017)]
MNDTHTADPAAGERLKQAREAAGLPLAEMAARTRLPLRVLETLESGEWDRLGAPVFVRGQARAYARALCIDLDDGALPSPFTTTQIPSLVSHSHVPRYRHVAENLVRRAVYVVMTVALVVPVWLATRSNGASDSPTVATLDVAPGATPREPVVASIAPIPAPTREAPAASLTLQFTGESWVQVFGRDGSVVERGLLRAGERRELRVADVGRVVLGNATAVSMQSGSRALDLAPYTQANVARFTLSSDGSLAPIAP